MSGSYISNVEWCPLDHDCFLTTGSADIQLYRVKSGIGDLQPNTHCLRLNKALYAEKLVTDNDHPCIKCTAWCPGLSNLSCHFLAVGQMNGRVAITSFNDGGDYLKLHGKEYIPKQSRAVNSLAWSTTDPEFLAAGLEKYQRDNSLIVLNVTRFPLSSESQRANSLTNSLKPVFEYGLGESVNSLVFSRTRPNTIVAAFNNKQIRLVDMKDTKASQVVTTKATKGLCTDPFREHRLASYIDNQAFVWDMRMLDRPVVTFTESKNIMKLAWSPSRADCLASLTYESSNIRLHNLQSLGHAGAHNQLQDVIVSSRSVISPSSKVPLSSFSWHPTSENRMLVASCPGDLMDVMLHERVTVNWGVRGSLVWTKGKNNLLIINTRHKDKPPEDISTAIVERAEKKYGLFWDDLTLNGEATDNQALKNVWSWLEQARSFTQAGVYSLTNRGPYRYQGVVQILNHIHHKSEVYNKHWVGQEGAKLSHIRAYRSDERSLALQLCSWGSDHDLALTQLCERLEVSKETLRAVAVCVFNLRLRQAISILNRAAESTTYNNTTMVNSNMYNTIAMALSGFTDQRNGLWRETCIKLQDKFSDPYLRATFSFLTNDGSNYENVLIGCDLAVQDRVGFACLYLNDTKLNKYLDTLLIELTDNGSLDALLLTGLSVDGVDLLQKYLDITGDVQTVALLCIHGMQQVNVKDDRLEVWIECYRSLLDSLRLWNERAKLDCIKNKHIKRRDKPKQQVSISCNFCSKSISAYIQTPGRAANPYARFGTAAANKVKMTSCPNCRKPLSRCSLCLEHLGTPSERPMVPVRSLPPSESDLTWGSPRTSTNKPLSPMATWFTWCQTCRHGGHAQHVRDWFNDHVECPVSSCLCKCMSVDVVGKLSNDMSKVSINAPISPTSAK